MKQIDSRAQGTAWGSLTPAQPVVCFSRLMGKLWEEQRGWKATLELNRFEEEDRIETVPSKCLQAPDIDLQTQDGAALVSHIAALLRKTVTNQHSA